MIHWGNDPLGDLFLEAHDAAPAEILLHVGATDDPLHGNQGGRFCHGYCRRYCYLPLSIFSDRTSYVHVCAQPTRAV